MKLNAEIENEKYEVEITRDGDSVTATVDGRVYQIEVTEPEPNVLLFKNNNKISELTVLNTNDGISNVRVGTDEFEIKLADPKRLRGSGSEAAGVDGLAEIRTAMPGKVVRVIASVGDSVSKGDGIIVVEAMKMQNELKATKDGIVKEIRFAEGATVNSGDILALID
jgi:biotin carboxyl carrier protein